MNNKTIAVILISIITATLLIGGVAIAAIRNAPPTFQEMQDRLSQMSDTEHKVIAKEAIEKRAQVEKEFAEQLRVAYEMPREVVAQVNGEDVLASDLVRHKAFLEKQARNKIMPFNVTNDMVINDIIREKAILAEAKKRGLIPTSQEIDEYVKWQREMLAESFNDVENPKHHAMNKEVWNSYLSGLGVTEKEFWTNIAPEEYARGLIVVKLRESIVGDVTQEDTVSPEDSQKQTLAWENFTEKLVSNAKIDVINSNIFKINLISMRNM